MSVPIVSQSAREHHYPCDCCGGDLRFAPGQDQLVCDYCGYAQPIPNAVGRGTARLREIDLASGLAARLPTTELETHRSVKCPNCAAEIAFQGANHASECPFCATPVVVDTGEKRQIKPQGVVPFVLTEAEARKAVGHWLGRLWFAPNGLVQYARRGRKMTGIYAPFWTFDAQTQSRYTGERGDAYYVSRTMRVRVNGKMQNRTTRERRIRWRPASGHVVRAFNDVLVYAARSLPPGYLRALAPWDLSALAPYRPDFLAGFAAEGYTVDLPDGHAQGRAEMARVIASDVRRDIGGDEQRIHTVETAYSDETFKHILLPVWTAAYKYRGKSYRFVVNAQTGQVRGDRPWSVWKIAFAVAMVALVIGGLAFWGNIQQS
ncbi:primosomal protein N' (replication factor Y) - superfamily II helicase [Rhodobacter sp. TJ_12]|uniref:primosomal protein N' (replication factor Y) - superfamily II helicase n=1 Tax=Rhodobacter sp. TJ_12 TaxID=2029399 RepID=UPI001CBB7471|nr:primosomal protein N' (replication factor Y) - superfamily II helicase [Rhodobacter sp. TJ_12]MBZ4021573.1 primosomal protein N' (replication factor Y) - superfamily II helicase [Rhodobacter sp. TJ_12]